MNNRKPKYNTKNRKVTLYEKDNVYLIDQTQKMVCVLLDDSMACLCPISVNRKNNGYKIKMSKAELRSNQPDISPNNILYIGKVKDCRFEVDPQYQFKQNIAKSHAN